MLSLEIPNELRKNGTRAVLRANQAMVQSGEGTPDLITAYNPRETPPIQLKDKPVMLLWIVTGLVGIILVVVTVWATWDMRRLEDLQNNGAVLGATVEDRYVRGEDYVVRYGYRMSNRTISREETVSADIYESAEPESLITVKVDPDDWEFSRLVEGPDNAVIELDGRSAPPLLLIVFGIVLVDALIVTASVVMLARPAIEAQRRVLQLRREGRLLTGEVSEIKWIESTKRRTAARTEREGRAAVVRYCFTAPSGRAVTGGTAPIREGRDWLESDVVPWATVLVLYVDDDLHAVL